MVAVIPAHTPRERIRAHSIEAKAEPAWGEGGGDCELCFTGKTRSCGCGGRVHNEWRGELTEACFGCGVGWLAELGGTR